MGKPQNNRQGETQLLAEWIATLPGTWKSKTHLKVGEQTLMYRGVNLTPAQQRAFSVWSDWADARIVTPSEVWLVEAKLVATGGAYGQLLDYLNQYPNSADALQFPGMPVVGVVVCQASRPRTVALFGKLGIRTIVFEPSFELEKSLAKLFPAAQILHDG